MVACNSASAAPTPSSPMGHWSCFWPNSKLKATRSADVLASMGAIRLSTWRELVQLLLDSPGVGIVSTNKNRPETRASDLLFVWCALRDSNPGPWD